MWILIVLRRLPLWLAKPSMRLLVILVFIPQRDGVDSDTIVLHDRTALQGYFRPTGLSDLTAGEWGQKLGRI
jgi:hypothetical protein